MVLVDIYVPSVDKTYDFQLNETTPVSAIIEEIGEMVGQKERSAVVGEINKLQLYDIRNKCILEKDRTLAECGIKTGKSLLFV